MYITKLCFRAPTMASSFPSKDMIGLEILGGMCNYLDIKNVTMITEKEDHGSL
jgi:hypothetical protein